MQIKPENDLSSRERVYQCIVELTNIHRAASRKRIAEMTGLALHIVDEQIRQLKNTNKVRKLENGVYELVLEFPPDEAISLTQLPNGLVRLEKGDTVMDLNPSEARTTGKMFLGYQAEQAAVLANRDTEVRLARLENQNRETRHHLDRHSNAVSALARAQRRKSKQQELDI